MDEDIFVAALNATGTGVRYVSLIGGESEEEGFGITVEVRRVRGRLDRFHDDSGPRVRGAGNHDLLVAKLSPTGVPVCTGPATVIRGIRKGTALQSAVGRCMLLEKAGHQPTPTRWDMLVARFQTDGTVGSAATLGGTNSDWGQGITVDASGSIYIAGSTWSPTGFTGTGSTRPFGGGTTDAVVVKLNSSLGVDFATYLGGGTTGGGAGDDYGYSIAVDTVQAWYVAGTTQSADFPILLGADDTTLGGEYRRLRHPDAP